MSSEKFNLASIVVSLIMIFISLYGLLYIHKQTENVAKQTVLATEQAKEATAQAAIAKEQVIIMQQQLISAEKSYELSKNIYNNELTTIAKDNSFAIVVDPLFAENIYSPLTDRKTINVKFKNMTQKTQSYFITIDTKGIRANWVGQKISSQLPNRIALTRQPIAIASGEEYFQAFIIVFPKILDEEVFLNIRSNDQIIYSIKYKLNSDNESYVLYK